MKVLMFGWEFPPHNSGGLGVACLGLVRSLSQSGVEVSFVLPRSADVDKNSCKMIFADNLEGVSFKIFDSLLSPYITPNQYNGLTPFKVNNYSLDLIGEVKRYAYAAEHIAKLEKFDVIHAHDWLSFLAGIEAKKISKKPLIVHVHATEFDRCGGENVNKNVYEIEKKGMIEADKVIAVSGFTKKIIVDRYGIDPRKVSVVHNGIDKDDHVTQHGAPDSILKLKKAGSKVVLFVGRITLQKGPDYFVKVAQKVLEHCPDTFFVVAGSGDMETRMIESTAFLKISDRFIFTGFLRGKELHQVYSAADLYIMPSVSEPFGIAPLEAIMNGAPVLISKQTGVGEVLSHALKSDFWDIDDMTDKVVSVLNHDSLRICLKEYGKSETEDISWKRSAEKCILIYRGD